MVSMTAESLILKTRAICKAATPGPFAILDSDNGWELCSYHDTENPVTVAIKMRELDAQFFNDAWQMLPDLADALEQALVKVQAFEHLAKTEATRIKAAYQDGRDARVDDRGSEHE